VCGQLFDGLSAVPQVGKFRNAKEPFAIVFRRNNSNEPLGIFRRNAAKKQSINHAEDGHVRGNAKSRRENGDESKTRIFAKNASSKAQILPARLHKGFPAARANDFLCKFKAAALQTHCAKGFLAAHPLLDLFFSCHLLVGAKLLIQLPVDLLLSEQ